MAHKVLIVDDDKNICELLRLYLEKEGYVTRCALDGKVALQLFEEWHPDLILLDVMLPYVGGVQVCEEIRRCSNLPILMITARSETEDKIIGLESGADDYVTKPFEPKEVMARVKALLRRACPQGERDDLIAYDQLQLNLTRYELWVKGKQVYLPAKEMELLRFLVSHPNRVFTRDQLLDGVWGFDYVGDTRTVDVHIKRLREKLEGVSNAWGLRTVYGVGYKFEVKENNEEELV